MTASAEITQMCVEMRQRGLSAPKIAQALNDKGLVNHFGNPWTTVAVQARLESSGVKFRRPSPPLSPELREWAFALLDDGVPATWVGESVGRDRTPLVAMYKRARGHGPRSGQEFARDAWSHIRFRPELRALHNEFMPKAGKGS